ncbi:vacuolar membrane amino acid uptake transporter Fnx1 [Schizosaccharomyces cryophilus OY26]|uniref:Vacuolar membrane amino acid uptake transporter Fnx1 n=1 Tax=Schizosaccharomyces cryophilus (strain OY26 / ATCC MYA-4695 / CBS 11777 / NBRC 106824 / NRRL Y48691) TaxID=653667 RepID=S9VZ12_SCHCR|nr:vacuolar membrane amino acid uptake transporter Fnx1 [Schizosaccharomyces cryophilus OY26]EPY52838.1 vacuolar membrane amino acid uptake transporter Fnx1 [Schizosaccharomyces cryophilus OY26]
MSVPNSPTEETALLGSDIVSKDDTKNHYNKWTILPALWIGGFLSALDMTIVASLYPVIGSEFKLMNNASYIATSYLITNTAFQPLYGRLSDIFGRRAAVVFANVTFTIGTFLCGTSRSLVGLCIARAIAGIGGGGLGTMSSIISSDIVSLRERGTWQGITNIVWGIGGSLGGPLGGLIAQRWGWRIAFFFQIPLGIVSTIVVAWRVRIKPVIRGSNAPLLSRIDYLGSFLLVSGISLLIITFSLAGDAYFWLSPIIIGLLTSSLLLLYAFYWVEKNVALEPIAPVFILKQITPLNVCLCNFFNAFCGFVILYELPLFFEAVLFMPSSEAGVRIFPHVIFTSLGSVLGGLYMKKTGRYRPLILFGYFGMWTSIVAFSVLLSFGQRIPSIYITLFLSLSGTSYGMNLTSTLIAIISSLAPEEQAVATGLSYLFRATGSVIGISLSQTATLTLVLSNLSKQLADVPGKDDLIRRLRESISIIPDLPENVRRLVIQSYVKAFSVSFVIVSGFALVGIVCSLKIRQFYLHTSTRSGNEEPIMIF